MENSLAIKFELSHMKNTIVRHLSEHQVNMNGELEKAVDQAVKDFDFQAEVTKVVSKEIAQQVERYFKYGAGHRLLENAVTESMGNLFKGVE